MSCIPIVWQHNQLAPPEWVLLEMQGELQFKENRLKKTTAATGTGSALSSFEGMEMGVLAPHAEHGPTRPELRIGNLVIQGKLVPLSKPLLVLTTRKLGVDAESAAAAAEHKESNGTSSALSSPVSDSTKRKREAAASDSKKAARAELANTSAASSSSAAATAAASSSAPSSTLPSSCLQTVAVIRHKYLFTSRPYAICDMGAAAVPSAAATAASAAAAQKPTRAH